MPLYEYECDACQHRFEVIQRFSDPPVSSCPVCGSSVRKLLSSPAIQFKGSGWYITDYARKGSNGSSGKEPAKSTGTTAEGTSTTPSTGSSTPSSTGSGSGETSGS
jgi:putative FmdB family regulatory protein